jgi:hypothetical protein
MKFKALRRKDTKEWVYICQSDPRDDFWIRTLPLPMIMDTTFEDIKEMYPNNNFDNYELITLECKEVD